MKLRDEERREGGVIGRSVRSSDQRDRRTEEKGERQRLIEKEGDDIEGEKSGQRNRQEKPQRDSDQDRVMVRKMHR